MILNLVAIVSFVFLGWTLGRNNLSNLFGAAIGTRMVLFKWGVLIAILGVCAGIGISSSATTENVSALGAVTSVADAFCISLSAGLILLGLSRLGVPASVTQTTFGAYIGWNLFYHFPLPKDLIIQTISAWVYTPFIAGICSFLLLKGMQSGLKRFPIRLFWRDHLIRWGLMGVGAFSAYAFGANNIGSLVGPYADTHLCELFLLLIAGGLSICLGFVFADKHVIQTVSSGMFPLTPLEAFVSVFSSALTLFLFSSIELKKILISFSLPSFPLVPVPLSGAVIGAIIGVAVAKGIEGLRFKLVEKIFLSWSLVPILSGFFAFVFLCFLNGGE